MSTDWEWIVPFKGRGHSGAITQNFLCRSGNVYVMDNHRAAMWCWLQQVNPEEPHSLIHIDRHYDALQSRLDEWMQNLPPWNAGIDRYLGAEYDCGGSMVPVIRWDNYLSVYLEAFGRNLTSLRCLTHDDGDQPNYPHTLFSDVWELPHNLSFWLDTNATPWIVNIDLDYFFCGSDEDVVQMVSDNYIDQVGIALRRSMDRGAVKVVTLCLTPDSFTPGWAVCEKLASRILAHLGLSFQLPRDQQLG